MKINRVTSDKEINDKHFEKLVGKKFVFFFSKDYNRQDLILKRLKGNFLETENYEETETFFSLMDKSFDDLFADDDGDVFTSKERTYSGILFRTTDSYYIIKYIIEKFNLVFSKNITMLAVDNDKVEIFNNLNSPKDIQLALNKFFPGELTWVVDYENL